MAREGHQIDWRLCEKSSGARATSRRRLCERRRRDGLPCLAYWGTSLHPAARRHIASSYYSITRCFYRRDRRDRRRHSKQQHVAWHNKRLRLPTVPLNRNNAACVIAEHSLLPAGLRPAICLKSSKKKIGGLL